MPALDFTEIPAADRGPKRDRFEFFARELLEIQGFTIVEQPDRGADGGRDLIVQENRLGPGGTTAVRWLVSCKHKAHSGASVTPADELNIRDRLGTHRCQGFIAFYSTLPSSGLGQTFRKLLPDFEFLQFDCEVIEQRLLNNPEGHAVARRYMSLSYSNWVQTAQGQSAADASPGSTPSATRNLRDNPSDSRESATASLAGRPQTALEAKHQFRRHTVRWHTRSDMTIGTNGRRNSNPLSELVIHAPEEQCEESALVVTTMTQGVDSFDCEQNGKIVTFDVSLTGSTIFAEFDNCNFKPRSRLGECESAANGVTFNGGTWILPGQHVTGTPLGDRPLLTLSFDADIECTLTLNLVCSQHQIDVRRKDQEVSAGNISKLKEKMIKRYIQHRLSRNEDGIVLLASCALSRELRR